MQKALIEMNIQLTNVLSDLSGVSGMAMVQAILDGKRNPKELAALADPQVKASKQVIGKSLRGNWRSGLLFVLGQEMDTYRAYGKRIVDCDTEVQQHLQRMESKVDLSTQPIGPRPKGKRARGKAPQTFDLRSELYRLTGVDWSQVDGMMYKSRKRSSPKSARI
jgi:transposase